MSRKKRNDEELLAASWHLWYEIAMFEAVTKKLASNPITQIEAIKNALLESFAIHTRVLLYVFYSKSPRKDDVIAEDYIENWKTYRPTMTNLLEKINKRVGKEIVHLSYDRLEIMQADKEWHFIEILQDMKKIIKAFLSKCPDKLLHENWKIYKQKEL